MEYINSNDVKMWWDTVHGKDTVLSETETIRVVVFTSTGVFTASDQIRSADELIAYMEKGYKRFGGDFGISASAAVFEYVPGKRPSLETFLRTRKLIIDVDAYVEGTKQRLNIAHLDNEWRKALLAQAHTIIYKYTQNKQIDWPKPQLIGLTGGGLQLIYSFDRFLEKEEAQRIFPYLSNNFPNKRYQTVIVSPLGPISTAELEFDSSSFDIIHVQRVLGSWNPKHKVFSAILHDWDPTTIANETYLNLSNFINQFTNIDDRNKFIERINKLKLEIDEAFMVSQNQFEADVVKNMATIADTRPLVSKANMSNLEYKIASSLNGGKSFDLVRDMLTVVKETPSFIALKCPFHEGDAHSSFAVYKNNAPGAIDVYLDFHDQQKYNIVTFYAKLKEISKSDAIDEIIKLANLDIKTSDRKELERISAAEAAKMLVERIDVENFIYYRLANKQKSCVIRHISSGKSYVFDGLRSMCRQILKTQLQVDEFSPFLLQYFEEEFERKVLVEGFERFHPGNPPVFYENDIAIINLWVETENYRKVKRRAQEYPQNIRLPEAIKLITKMCPYTNIFVHQLVQHGSIPWFYNWLVLTTQFKVTPTIPFHYGNYGVGKNLFVNEVLEYFLNEEYINIVNTEQITKNFNAHMESSQLIVIDESSLYDSKSVDALKMFSGNKRVKIEKKGIDAVDVDRFFNFMTFSNREEPAYITTQERRFSFFHSTIPLTSTVKALGITIEEFIEQVRTELDDFFAILMNTMPIKEWENMNIKDGAFYEVVFKGHHFGKLLLTMMDNDWDGLVLQLSENVKDDARLNAISNLIYEIRDSFRNNGTVPLPLINRYLESVNYKNRMSVADFVKNNMLDHIIKMRLRSGSVYIGVDTDALRKLLECENSLLILFKHMDLTLSDTKTEEQSKVTDFEILTATVENIAQTDHYQEMFSDLYETTIDLNELIDQVPTHAPPKSNSNSSDSLGEKVLVSSPQQPLLQAQTGATTKIKSVDSTEEQVTTQLPPPPPTSIANIININPKDSS